MVTAQIVRYRDEFYPNGFRKIFALAVVVAVTVLPEAFNWMASPAERPAVSRMPSGRFAPRGGFLPDREPPRLNILGAMWTFTKRAMVVVITTAGLVMYYPRPGYKRYALLCGPIIGLLVPWCMRLYLQGRTEVFRAEVLVVALVALVPGIFLYAFLTWRKARRMGMEW